MSFRKPLLIPSTVSFVAEGARDGGFDLALRNAKKRTEHVRGSVRPLA